MQKTITVIRCLFFCLSIIGAGLVWLAGNFEGKESLVYYLVFGALMGALTILVDVFLKGFSLRGLTAVTFGLAMGALIAFLISASPLLEYGDEVVIFQVRLGLFIVSMYLGAVIALRGRDEFNLVIPYIKFVPQKIDTPLVVLDTSALIDGRILGVCKSKFLASEFVIPRFVVDELQHIADSQDTVRQEKGRKGLQILNELRKLPHIHITIHESELAKPQEADAKLVFVAQSVKGKLLTTDYNLAKLAEFHNIDWLNLNSLAKALSPNVTVGERFEVELIRSGKESGQAVGYLGDGSMVVVNQAEDMIGQTVNVEVVSVIPSAGGKMVFTNMTK